MGAGKGQAKRVNSVLSKHKEKKAQKAVRKEQDEFREEIGVEAYNDLINKLGQELSVPELRAIRALLDSGLDFKKPDASSKPGSPIYYLLSYKNESVWRVDTLKAGPIEPFYVGPKNTEKYKEFLSVHKKDIKNINEYPVFSHEQLIRMGSDVVNKGHYSGEVSWYF